MSDNNKYNFQAPSTKSVLAFLFLPEFKRSLPAFAHIGPIFIRTIAIMFVQAGLLRPNHPSLMYGLARDVPKFKFSDLIGEAWYNLRVNDGNTPYQYGMFIGVIMMICLTIISAFFFVTNLVLSSAQAQIFDHPFIADTGVVPDTSGPGIFQTSQSSPDFAIDILNKVVRQAAYDKGAPLSKGLGAVMEVYNVALLVIASLVVFWAIISIIVDTARTGQIGGGRHSIVWIPIRFVFALALMIPLGTGFSGGQLITLKLAEWGSNLGTNGWVAYVQSVTDETMIAAREARPATDLLVNLARLETCRMTYNALSNQAAGGQASPDSLIKYKAQVAGNFTPTVSDTLFPINFNSTANQVRSLVWNRSYTVYVGNDSFASYCGTVTLMNPNFFPDDYQESELMVSQRTIKNLKQAHNDAFFSTFIQPAQSIGCGLTHEFNNIQQPACASPNDAIFSNNVMPDGSLIEQASETYKQRIQTAVNTAIQELQAYIRSSGFLDEMRAQGWAGMGIWYYKIQNVNSAMDAALSPTVSIKPGTMEGHHEQNWFVSLFKDKESDEVLTATVETINKYDAWWSAVSVGAAPGSHINRISRGNVEESSQAGGTTASDSTLGGIVEDIFKGNWIDAGSTQIFSIGTTNNDLYPLASLVSFGNWILGFGIAGYIAVASISAVAGGTELLTLGVSGAVVTVLEGPVGDLISTILMLMITAGLVIKYYVPIIPWIRVTFAVLSWIVSVFEAVIIVPLLALANLSTEGEGLFTQTGRNLWVSSLNILMRPILTVIGYVASLLIFNAMVVFVNNTFSEALTNSSGATGLLFPLTVTVNSVIYVFIIFTLANSTFKTIDLLPNAIMRWMGGPQDTDFQDSSIEGFIMAAGQHTSRMAGGMAKGPRGKLKERMEANEGDPGAGQSKGSGGGPSGNSNQTT